MLPRAPRSLALVALVACATAARCGAPESGGGRALFASPQVQPLVLAEDGARLYVANTTSHSVSVIDTRARRVLEEIAVGLEPVSVALRPDGRELWVANHVSDSISVIDTDWRSPTYHRVLASIQDLDPDGVTRLDEPAGIAFASSAKAYVALSSRNQVAIVDIDPPHYRVRTGRLAIPAQEPRAIQVRDGRLYVAAFESGNRTELSACELADGTPQCSFGLLEGGRSFAVNPNMPDLVKHIVVDPDLPDRDVFVFATADERPLDVVSGVGTLLYGLAVDSAGRVFVAHTDARNAVNGLDGAGLADLGNRIFLNRLAVIDCGGSGCAFDAARDVLDLEPPPPQRPAEGRQLATPYGVAVSGDDTTVFVTAAASSRLASLDAGSGALLDVVDVGPIPRGVALRSHPVTGAPRTAYVLDSLGNTISVVDVQRPERMRVAAAIPVGNDPTPEAVRLGRIAFEDAGASSSGTFACASCHPDGHTDQLLWRIGGACSPDLDPGCGDDEPRTTQPIRGLRNTLPLHWDGTLGDPFGGGNGAVGRAGDGGVDCALDDADGDHDCFLDLVRASLAGVMCDPSGPCPPGGSELSEASQRDMATFLASVWHPPARSRPLADAVSERALDGFADFFVDQGGVDRGTCADSSLRCHVLPLGSSHDGSLGAFDAPSLRGLTDRFVQFSAPTTSAQEILEFFNAPPPPFAFARSEFPWDPAVGLDERTTFAAAFLTFRPILGVGPVDIFQMVEEASTGTSGATGRQVTLTREALDGEAAAETLALLDALEAAAARDAVELRGQAAEARLPRPAPMALVYRPGADTYGLDDRELSRGQLEAEVRAGRLVATLTGHLPARFGEGIHRQPLLAPAGSGVGPTGDPPLPFLTGQTAMTLEGSDVRPGSRLLLDGSPVEGEIGCLDGSFGSGFCSSRRLRVALAALPPAGLHLLQVQSPHGPVSNELPICVGSVAACR
jgi:YVTN family beta-propeller protein